jgi:TonB family protein
MLLPLFAALLGSFCACAAESAPKAVGQAPGVRWPNNINYPVESRRNREEGTVTLRVQVLANGQVGECSIATSSGHPRLDAAALEAAKHWTFKPARRDGRPVDNVVLVPIKFVLEQGDEPKRAGGDRTLALLDRTRALPSGKGHVNHIHDLIGANIVFSEPVVGDASSTVAEIATAPDGTIVGTKLVRSSGIPAWDEAVLTSIRKTGSLPPDDHGDRAPATLQVGFHPNHMKRYTVPRSYHTVSDYSEAIRVRVRRNLVPPRGESYPSSTEATVDVALSETGDILDIKLIKSSGNAPVDDAIVRALQRTSPLPLLEEANPRADDRTGKIKNEAELARANPRAGVRTLRLVFRPFEHDVSLCESDSMTLQQ